MDANDIYDLLKKLGMDSVVIRGSNVMACCPFHEERKPSWGVSVLAPYKHGCFSCGAKGTLVDVLVKIGKMSQSRAMQICGVGEHSDEMPEFAERGALSRQLKLIDHTELYPFTFTPEVVTFVKKRGLNARDCRELGLVHNKADNRLMFPWKFNAKLVGVTGRAMDDNPAKTLPYYGTKKGQCLYLPVGGIRPKRFIITEGEIDALKIKQAGFPNVGAIGFGRFTDDQARLVLTSGATEVVTFFDDDETGQLLTDVVIKKLGNSLPVMQVDYTPYQGEYINKLYAGELKPQHIHDMLTKVKRFSDWPTF
jgi:DNA primase